MFKRCVSLPFLIDWKFSLLFYWHLFKIQRKNGKVAGVAALSRPVPCHASPAITMTQATQLCPAHSALVAVQGWPGSRDILPARLPVLCLYCHDIMPSHQLTIGQQGNCTKSKKERRGVTVFVNMFFLKLNSYSSWGEARIYSKI